uniref:Uncharacterized protein n=1 Tax=Fagus sylvatica TaxID=28930 RepID=A0A2N9ERU6_FAGSY
MRRWTTVLILEAQIPNPSQNGGGNPRNEEGGNQNQDQNDEGSSANQNRQPWPSQVIEPTRSTADLRAVKLEEELKKMREKMKEMKSQVKAKAARNLDMLVHCSESPFTNRVDDYPLPTKFKVPQLENFDGLRDPLDYLDSFRTVIRLQGVSKEIMCRAFPTNLRGSARVWFNQLETGSIDTFAQMLKKAFTWMDECQKSFEELKKYLTSPSLLSPSKQGEHISLYLAVSLTAVSSALIREENGVQLPVYYTSKAFQGADERYPAMEKLALALVVAAKKLRPYFQAHTIIVLTNHPLRKAKRRLLKHAVRLQYPTTNNEAEYEALLTGLHIAKILGVTTLKVQSDSQLVVRQVNGEYEAKEERMRKYLDLVRSIMTSFNEVIIVQVLREQNIEADALAKLASSEEATRQQIKIQNSPSHKGEEMNPIDISNSWMTPIIRYLKDETLLTDTVEARKLKVKATRRTQSPTPELVINARGLETSPIRYQRYLPQWGLDIMGPFLVGQKQLKFLVVGIDYFTKWVEAEPLATITEKNFDNSLFREFYEEMGIHNHYSSLGHPQANRQVEVTNRFLLKMIKTRHEGAKGLWSEELPNVLWAYRTTTRTPTGESPFRLTFGTEAVIPVEIGLTSFRIDKYDEESNNSQLRLNLDLLDEARDQVEVKTKAYQQRMARYYDRRVKHREFEVGDLVLRKVTFATKDPTQGKLGPTSLECRTLKEILPVRRRLNFLFIPCLSL